MEDSSRVLDMKIWVTCDHHEETIGTAAGVELEQFTSSQGCKSNDEPVSRFRSRFEFLARIPF
jgi:hypothetical protein